MRRRAVTLVAATMLATGLMSVEASPASADTRSIPSAGTTSIRPSPHGADAVQAPELRSRRQSQGEAGTFNRARPEHKNRIFPRRPLDAARVRSSQLAGANPEVTLSFDGLNHRDQRLANGGNQFSLEPPDQALCVGNGYTVESTNGALRVFASAGGAPLTGVQDLNSFFNYPAAIDRTTGVIGPNTIDPVCYYDAGIDRFFVVITTLHVNAAGDFNGKNTLDLAVSDSGDPTGQWTIYNVPAHNDGTDGTPNHGCTTDGTTPGPCFQDYPHVGADRYGFYISTNEYDLFGPRYGGAQVYAFSKAQLAARSGSVNVTLVEDLQLAGTPGFTVWPATSPPGHYASQANGTEFFLSTVAGDGSETGNPTGTARKIGVWALTNTASLDTATPDVRITSRAVSSLTYVVPAKAEQKAGDIPLGQCLNDTTGILDPMTGLDCWQLFFNPPPTWQPEAQSTLDAGDTRMQQTWYVDGVLWGAIGTAVQVKGEIKTGIAWFAVDPRVNRSGRLSADVRREGYVALGDNNLTYPALAMTPEGKGAIAFTIVGETFYPSAGYVTIDRRGRVSPIHVVASGLGPSDGFTSYKAFVGDPPRTRWGDYGAAVTDGTSIWIASEYIAQTCSLDTYLFGGPIGSCGGTRTALANWATRVARLY